MFDLVVARHGLAAPLTGPPDEAAARLAAVIERLRTAFPPGSDAPPQQPSPALPKSNPSLGPVS